MRAIFRWLGKLIRAVFSLFFTFILIGVGIYIDARYIEPKLLCVKEEAVTTSKWADNTSVKVVLFNDIHLGEHYSLNDFERVVVRINALKPDVIIFAGDLIDNNKTFTQEEGATQLLAKLQANYGKFAVYGNHDHGGNGTRRYARMMSESGFNLLMNENELISLDNGKSLCMIGIDDIVLSKPDYTAAFDGVGENSFNLFISHAPDVVEHIVGMPIDLQVSGHTHGGQVRLPIIGAPFTVPYGKEYVKGWYTETENEGMKLYVNSGIGTSSLPYRFLNPPEITIFTIKGA